MMEQHKSPVGWQTDDYRLPIGTLVLCDSQFLLFSVRDSFGDNRRADYLKLRELLEKEVSGDPPHSYIVFQAFVAKYDGSIEFSDLLKAFGYQVEERSKLSGGPFSSSSWLPEITTEAILKKDRYQRMVFVAGDGHLIRLVETLRQIGIEVWVVSFPASLSPQLAEAANRTIILGEETTICPK